MRKRMGDRWGFEFPEKGWTCKGCTNYNFPKRTECKRCSKLKDDQDCVGKPTHLNKQKFYYKKPKDTQEVDTSTGFNMASACSVAAFEPTLGGK